MNNLPNKEFSAIFKTSCEPMPTLIGMKLCYMGTQNFIFLSIQQNAVLITAGAVRIIGADYTS